MKPVIPHEHGGWAFLAVPLIVGTWLGNPSVYHLLLFFSWLLFYMGTYAMREWLKRKGKEKRYFYWMLIYGSLAAIALIPPLWRELSLSIVLLLILPSIVINLFSIYQKNERGMLNNIAAFHAFALGAVAAYVLGTGTWDLMVLCFICIVCCFLSQLCSLSNQLYVSGKIQSGFAMQRFIIGLCW